MKMQKAIAGQNHKVDTRPEPLSDSFGQLANFLHVTTPIAPHRFVTHTRMSLSRILDA